MPQREVGRHRAESRLRRAMQPPNLVVVAIGLFVFFLLAAYWDSYTGAALAALIGSVLTALTWLAWWRWGSGARVAHEFDMAPLGIIPHLGEGRPAPTITEPTSDAAQAYVAAIERLQATTNGHVLLVASPAPGQGSSTVAMNLAISATQLGRRVVLVDGDPSRRGLSRFGRTGSTPGLFELAAGSATLATASRLWSLDDQTRLPFIPAGDPTVLNGKTLASNEMADAIGTLTEGADLILIDVPPIAWNGTIRPLAAHADGTVLVVTERTNLGSVAEARNRLDDAGAPVLGFVMNRAQETAEGLAWPWRRALYRLAATFALALVAFVAWNAFQIWDSWRGVGRDQLDVAQALELLPLPAEGIVEEEITEDIRTVVTATPTAPDVFQSFLLVGSDEGGARADVITLLLVPPDDDPAIVSIPRDLYLPNRCTQSYARINTALAGCGDVNGPTMLALAVEDFTGIPVDHFALFDFSGFQQIIDELGGIEICVHHAVRDAKSFLNLPAGCTTASGEQALAWVRSRRTEELRDGRWRRMEGVSDLTRNARQQDVVLAMFRKMRAFDSVGDLTRTVRSLTDTFTLDDQLGISDAVALAWSLRDIDPTTITRIEIPVDDFTTNRGARVLVPTRPFSELLEPAFPRAQLDPT